MREDLGDHRRIDDGGDDGQGAAAVGTLLNIDIENPFEQLGGTDAGWRRGKGGVTAVC